MLESEPTDPLQDDEGSEPAHRPIWVIKTMAGTGEPGSEHSPHPAPIPGIDHVIGLDAGTKRFFSAQWHVHAVTEGEPFDLSDIPGSLANLTRTDGDGNYLTSADAIRAASEPDVFVTPIPDVFTCPVRPHNHT